MPTNGTTTDDVFAGLPAACKIVGWTVFGAGYWKGRLYSAADCQQMGRNFQMLSAPRAGVEPLLEPSAKVGHNLDQRLKESLGFPSLGTITGCRVAPNGLVTIDLDGIPTQFGALINAGRYRDGSIEIAPPLPHPDDQSQELYPVMTGVSFLGEEQPAVPVRFPIPKCTFADGTPVPPDHDITPLFQAMAEVSRNFAARSTVGSQVTYRGRAYSTTFACFSAMSPIPTPKAGNSMSEEQKAALAAKGYTPEQIADIEATMAPQMAAVPPTEDPKAIPPATMTADDKGDGMLMSAKFDKFAADPETPEPTKELMSAFSAFAASCSKRFGAMEAAVGDIQKDKPDLKAAAAFAGEYRQRVKADHEATVTRDVDAAILAGKLERRDRADKILAGLAKNHTQAFSAGHASAGKTEYAAWRDEMFSRRPSRMFSQDIEEPKAGDPMEDPFVRRALASLPGGRQLAYTPAETAAK